MQKNKDSHAMIVAYIILLVLAVVLILWFGTTPKEETEKIGFITTGSIESSGWSAINYEGLKAACEELGVELAVYSDVPELDGTCPSIVQKLADDGVGMIILNSHGYSQEMKDLLDQYPDIVFYGASADYEASNLTSYSIRMYQARYLSGIVAGLKTQTGKIGFVAAEKKPEVYRGINAFTLGVRHVNPTAEVVVAWSGSLDDEEMEKKLARELIEDEGVDLITYHQNHPYVIEVAEELGVYSIGYYEPVDDVSDKYLTCAMGDWEPMYENLIQEYLRGQRNSTKSDWLGLESDVVLLADYSPLVPDTIQQEVEEAREGILSGQDVFSGVIFDNEGTMRCARGEAISDYTLLYEMDWLVEGVRVYEE